MTLPVGAPQRFHSFGLRFWPLHAALGSQAAATTVSAYYVKAALSHESVWQGKKITRPAVWP